MYPTGRELRAACRSGAFDGPTSGHALGYVQANMVILPAQDAESFALFCQRNPGPCPVLEILEPGNPEPGRSAPGADIRTDLPRYRVFRHGMPSDEVTGIAELWRDDLVTFLLGCSFTAEEALCAAGLQPRHIAESGIVPMYRTTRRAVPAGRFEGEIVVSMRPYRPEEAQRASAITARYPMAHGAPLQIGDPESLGIRDISTPDYGLPVTIRDGEVPVFWACGVTPQEALRNARPELAITHLPGHMFVSDVKAGVTQPGGGEGDDE